MTRPPLMSLHANLKSVTDKWQRGKVLHKLEDILFISVVATIANAGCWEEIADFGAGHVEWFRRFIELPNGAPSHDTFERAFKWIDGKEFGYAELKDVAKSKGWSILNDAEIKPHRIRYYLERRDLEFESKMHEILLIYKQIELMFDENGNIAWPDEEYKTITVSYDEKPGIQAIANVTDNLQSSEAHGFVARDSEYKRLGTVSLLAGIDLQTGEVIARISDTHKSADFVAFLKVLDEKYNKGDKIRLSWITILSIHQRKRGNTLKRSPADLSLFSHRNTVPG